MAAPHSCLGACKRTSGTWRLRRICRVCQNLSQEGHCWIYNQAICCEGALVTEDARLYDGAIARDSALISGDARMFEQAKAEGNSIVLSGEIKENARVAGGAEIKRTNNGLSPLIGKDSNVYGSVCGGFIINGNILQGETLFNSTEDMIVLEDGKWDVLIKQRKLKPPEQWKNKENRKQEPKEKPPKAPKKEVTAGEFYRLEVPVKGILYPAGNQLPDKELVCYRRKIQYMLRSLRQTQKMPDNGRIFVSFPEGILKRKILASDLNVYAEAGQVYGAIEIETTDPMTSEEESKICDYLQQQFSKGWGNWFHQKPIPIGDKTLVISFQEPSAYVFTKKNMRLQILPIQISMAPSYTGIGSRW